MKRLHRPLVLAVSLALFAGLPLTAAHGAANAPVPSPKTSTMPQTAQGSFEVQLTQAPAAPGVEAAKIGRMSIRKQFHGDLEGSSLGEMLAVRTDVAGSAGYVAIERVEGKLAGRSGSFALMHLGEMARGQQRLTVQVIPDSGTGDLAGLSGTMTIEIRDGGHFYDFQYQLPGR